MIYDNIGVVDVLMILNVVVFVVMYVFDGLVIKDDYVMFVSWYV